MFANNWLPILFLQPDFRQLNCFLDGKPQRLQCFLTEIVLLDRYLIILFAQKRIVSANHITATPTELLTIQPYKQSNTHQQIFLAPKTPNCCFKGTVPNKPMEFNAKVPGEDPSDDSQKPAL
jgi:hypothetical protein